MSSSKNNLSHAWLMATWILGGSEMLGPATTKNSLKINMEPQNHPLEKENHLPSLHLLCSMLIFQGVPFLTRIFRETSWACWRPAARVCLWAELRVPPILPICSMYDIRVDGSEFRNPANSPVDMEHIWKYHSIHTVFIHPRWLLGISQPSTVAISSTIL